MLKHPVSPAQVAADANSYVLCAAVVLLSDMPCSACTPTTSSHATLSQSTTTAGCSSSSRPPPATAHLQQQLQGRQVAPTQPALQQEQQPRMQHSWQCAIGRLTTCRRSSRCAQQVQLQLLEPTPLATLRRTAAAAAAAMQQRKGRSTPGGSSSSRGPQHSHL